MYWILAKNLNSDAQYENLLSQIHRQGYDYTLVGVVPFSGEVAVVEGVPLHSIEGPVFCCGKGSMKHVARHHGFDPGYIDAATYVECLAGYGSHMLNADATIGKLGEVSATDDRFFVRPNNDDKSFNGTVMNRDDFAHWQRTMSDMEDSATITKDDIIILSSLKEIYAEYRFYVVDGRVVTGSLYKVGDLVRYAECQNETVIAFAQKMVDLYAPSEAFVLDIADTPDGLRVLETNSISSSGFYAIDIGKYVNAISNLRG